MERSYNVQIHRNLLLKSYKRLDTFYCYVTGTSLSALGMIPIQFLTNWSFLMKNCERTTSGQENLLRKSPSIMIKHSHFINVVLLFNSSDIGMCGLRYKMCCQPVSMLPTKHCKHNQSMLLYRFLSDLRLFLGLPEPCKVCVDSLDNKKPCVCESEWSFIAFNILKHHN